MDAEKKASTVVAEARAARSDRLKAAKAEAGAAVDDRRSPASPSTRVSSDSDARRRRPSPHAQVVARSPRRARRRAAQAPSGAGPRF